MYQDYRILAASIVYRYLVNTTPRLASRFLSDNPEVDMQCNISLEEVVKCYRKKRRNISETSKIKCSRQSGGDFCRCPQCQEMNKSYKRGVLYTNRKRRRNPESGDRAQLLKLNYRHFDRSANYI
eukprot:GFUD01005495.1.p1 GENE.GFUD01005495.1~~GFUD01005495.1.p1  ORF type:complete len:138 (+),score=29.23 GFUD01005495.1:41-415(+)